MLPQRILGTGVTTFQVKQRLLRIRRLPLQPETGDPPGAETIAGVAAIAAARRPTTRSGFRGQTSFGKWWSANGGRGGGRDEELAPGHRQSR